MVAALLSSQKLTLSEWEPHIPGQTLQAQSYERRWQRFFSTLNVSEIGKELQILIDRFEA
jgi:hypothetical protein